MDRYKFAIELAKISGEKLKEYSKDNIVVSSKGDDRRNVLTNADKEISALLVSKIKDNFPSDSVYSEEGGGEEKESEYEWTLDPIDGSANFARGIPHFASSISLLENGEPILGAVYNPITDEMFSFEKGKGAFLNSIRINASQIDNPKDAHSFLRVGRNKDLLEWGLNVQKDFLENLKKVSNFGTTSLDLCFLASGRVDVVVYGTFTTKDVAGSIGLLLEAGGLILTPKGLPVSISEERQPIVAVANKKLFEGVQQFLHTELLPKV